VSSELKEAAAYLCHIQFNGIPAEQDWQRLREALHQSETEPRKAYVRAALSSYKELSTVINELTEGELHAALSVESQSQRRPAVLKRMVRRLTRLIEIRAKDELTRRYLSGS